VARKTAKRQAKKVAKASSRKKAAKKAVARNASTRRLIQRVARPAGLARAAQPRSGNAPAGLQEATLDSAAGPVTVEIAFGFAQHGTYTIQLFTPDGTQQLAAEPGVSTDTTPDRFTLQPTVPALNGHILQWSGAVDAFTPAPGQQFSVLFDVQQGGRTVPGGHVEKTGPLDVTQAFLGALRLVTA
jgi:hypothetical protein